MNLNNLINFGAVVNDPNANSLNLIIVILTIVMLILIGIFMFSPKD